MKVINWKLLANKIWLIICTCATILYDMLFFVCAVYMAWLDFSAINATITVLGLIAAVVYTTIFCTTDLWSSKIFIGEFTREQVLWDPIVSYKVKARKVER